MTNSVRSTHVGGVLTALVLTVSACGGGSVNEESAPLALDAAEPASPLANDNGGGTPAIAGVCAPDAPDCIDTVVVDGDEPAPQPGGISVRQVQVRIDSKVGASKVGAPFYVETGVVRAGSDGELAEVPVSFTSEWANSISLNIPPLRYELEPDGTVVATADAESVLAVVEPRSAHSTIVEIVAGGALDPGVWEADFDVHYRRDALDRDPEHTASFRVRVEILSEDRFATVGPFCDEARRLLGVSPPGSSPDGMLHQMTQLDKAAQTLSEPDRARIVAEIEILVAHLNVVLTTDDLLSWSSGDVVAVVSDLCGPNGLMSWIVQP